MKKFTIILGLLLTVLLTGCGSGLPTPQELMGDPETRSIKSCVLNSNEESHAHGQFILGVGIHNSSSSIETKYYIYVKGVEGYRLQEIDADNLEIVETDEIEPCIKGWFSDDGKVYQNVYEIDEYDISDYYKSDFEEFLNYTIYVPVGTIKEQFSTDLPE